MRRRRNPRRSYDEARSEAAPPTVGSAHAQGEITAWVSCHDCGHGAIVATDQFPPDLPIPDIALRLRQQAHRRDAGHAGALRAARVRDRLEDGDEALVDGGSVGRAPGAGIGHRQEITEPIAAPRAMRWQRRGRPAN